MATALAMPSKDAALLRHSQTRLIGMRVTRYSWWVHARELADYLLPRRYRWIVTPNQASRGSPINQHILDSTGTRAARDLSSGLVSGLSSPTRPWIKLKIGRLDSTGTNPISLWLAEVERLMMMVFQESNFYTAIGVFYFDLVIFGTASLLIYENFENVINCQNPAFGEYYVDVDGENRPKVFYREFTMTIAAVVDRFGIDNCSTVVRSLYTQANGAGWTREIIVAHAIEPNVEPAKFGIPSHFKFREVYWEYSGSQAQQSGSDPVKFLSKRGFFTNPAAVTRWDIISNDPYGRSPGMDALPDVKQLQQETRRKGQGIDKGVNPPMVADGRMKNQPASLLPGGVTYIDGMMQTGNAGFAPVYGAWRPDISAITEDLAEVRERIKDTFFVNLFRTISQFETRSNVTAVEIDARRAEALIMLGPVLGRIENEGLDTIVDRVYDIMMRSGILPQPPDEIAGAPITVEYVSILALAQQAAAASGIDRILQVAGSVASVNPEALDKIDTDYVLDKYNTLMHNDPKLIRSQAQVDAMRAARAKQQQAAQQAEMMEKMAPAAKNLSETDLGGGRTALGLMTGITP